MPRLLLTLVIASAFGPYLSGGARTEHVVAYGLAVLTLVSMMWLRIRWTGAAVVVAGAWLVYLAVAGVGWLGGFVANTSTWVMGSPLANLDNLALPLATFLLVHTLAAGRDVTGWVTGLVTVGVALNAVVALGQYLGRVTSAHLAPWWGAGDTADRAVALSRYTGIAGQPSVAGVLYTLGLLSAIHALRRHPVWQAAGVAVITLAGVLTVSKGFLLVGLPLGAWLLLWGRGRVGKRFAVLLAAAGIYAGAVSLGLVGTWSGWERVTRFLPGGDATFTDYTGNRYGAGSSTERVIDATMADHPFAGYGLAGLATATDTAFVQALVLAGLIGVACVAVVLVAFVVAYRRGGWPEAERRFYLAFTTAVVVLAFGTPALTANRVSVLVWALLAVLAAQRSDGGAGGVDPVGAVRPDRLAQGGVEVGGTNTGVRSGRASGGGVGHQRRAEAR